MDEVLHNPYRIGNFTSSTIVALTSMGKREMTKDELAKRPSTGKGSRTTLIEDGFGQPALTYIHEKNMERRLASPLETEKTAKPLQWGKLVEKRVFDLLGLEYQLRSSITIPHPDIDCWAGSPDVFKINTVGDIKCPMTKKSFCQLVDPLYNGLAGIDAMNAIRHGYQDKNGNEYPTHTDGDKFYWQIVSNAILLEKHLEQPVNFGELIVYMPYKSELDEIRRMTAEIDGPEQLKYYWLFNNSNDEELPYLNEGGYYKNINVINFEIPQSDKDFLTTRIIEASKLLIPRQKNQLTYESI